MIGHGLVGEGAPHNSDGIRLPKAWGGVAGGGHAKCACGEVSPDLSSGNARKAWHREHKTAVRAQDLRDS